MPQPAFDCVIRGGRVGTAIDELDADIGIEAGVIAGSAATCPPESARSTPGTASSFLAASTPTPTSSSSPPPGIVNADTFESATASAALGGTTTVLCFAAQHRGMNLMTVVNDYMSLARMGAVVDYSFHLIIANPSEATLKEHVPVLVAQGHSTLKVFMPRVLPADQSAPLQHRYEALTDLVDVLPADLLEGRADQEAIASLEPIDSHRRLMPSSSIS